MNAKPQKSESDQDQIIKWQNKLLPWLIIMPTALILIFIYLTYKQLENFNEVIAVEPMDLLADSVLVKPAKINAGDSVFLKNQKYIRWVTLTKLEQESYYRRYNQAGLLLMSRIYKGYMGFFTGMILAIVGSVFIIGKIKESTSEIEGSISEKIKFSVVSSSPGIIFGVLGTVLMLATIITHHKIQVEDTPMYLNENTIMSLDLVDYMDIEADTRTDNTQQDRASEMRRRMMENYRKEMDSASSE
jgi:hypothetical protein